MYRKRKRKEKRSRKRVSRQGKADTRNADAILHNSGINVSRCIDLDVGLGGYVGVGSVFCTDTGRNRETRIDRSHPGTIRELGADPAR